MFLKVVFVCGLITATVCASQANNNLDNQDGEGSYFRPRPGCSHSPCNLKTTELAEGGIFSSLTDGVKPADEADVIKGLIHDMEVAANGEEEHIHSFKESLKRLLTREGLKEWARSFNIKRNIKRTYTFYQKNKNNAAVQEHIKNLVFILPFSHGLEMLFGPVMTSIGATQGWSGGVIGALGVVGAVISIPGIDPICILIYTTYPLKPVRTSITYARKGTVATFGFLGTITGLRFLYRASKNKLAELRSIQRDEVFAEMQTPVGEAEDLSNRKRTFERIRGSCKALYESIFKI